MRSLVFLVFGFTAGLVTGILLKGAATTRQNDPNRLMDDIERRFESLEVENN